MPLLFTYGMLQRDDVQLSTFGRLLVGDSDALIGFTLGLLLVADPEFVAKSGKAEHAAVRSTGRDVDRVSGIVYEVSENELAEADRYEPAGYARILAPLASGRRAWVYVAIGERGGG